MIPCSHGKYFDFVIFKFIFYFYFSWTYFQNKDALQSKKFLILNKTYLVLNLNFSGAKALMFFVRIQFGWLRFGLMTTK